MGILEPRKPSTLQHQAITLDANAHRRGNTVCKRGGTPGDLSFGAVVPASRLLTLGAQAAYLVREGFRRQADCDHVPRDLAVLVHWVHHPRFGDFLIDTGFDDSFAKHPPYGNYTEAMRLFNWVNGLTNRQEPGVDLSAQLARLNPHPKAVFITHLHPAVANHFRAS